MVAVGWGVREIFVKSSTIGVGMALRLDGEPIADFDVVAVRTIESPPWHRHDPFGRGIDSNW
jgi:hypothetical protein